MTIPSGENAAQDSEDAALATLRRDFAGHRIWRSTRHDGKPGDWVATLHDPGMGVDATVMQPSPDELRASLEAEARRAQERRSL
ncbi:hypothetical protein [Actinomadura macrotermitis]|uniref:Uncharacterized protein n=1 Tax=Actinomadura macrotermitis TaxID=2585200 RepID=A0A7K0BXB5_9ACTN|nr:hypothetical protein [Actinomadura macrotermitis]MQY05716.1 hypothetical protein [Actinomadura macrotermitis]